MNVNDFDRIHIWNSGVFAHYAGEEESITEASLECDVTNERELNNAIRNALLYFDNPNNVLLLYKAGTGNFLKTI